MESLPVLLQLTFLLFGIGLIVYEPLRCRGELMVTCAGCAFYACIAVSATIRSDCPFQTPLSVLLPKTTIDEGVLRTLSCSAGAMVHRAPTADRTGGRARSSGDSNRTFVQDFRWENHHR
jgi:hypothetical protein